MSRDADTDTNADADAESTAPPARLRVAAVGYINARPLWEALRDEPSVELALGSPSEVARQLAEDEADVALLPVVAAAALGDATLIDAGCIASSGPVRSVVVYSDCPTEEIEELALDLSSRTSVVLGRLLLRDALGGRREPLLRAMSPQDALAFAAQPDGRRGALVIGDPALAAEGRFAHTFDLAEAWRKRTGLPFVFAAWFARKSLGPAEVELLQHARDVGLARRDAIAADCAAESGLPVASLQRYLGENIRYTLGAAEREGLARFLAEAAELGLVPRAAPPAHPRPAHPRPRGIDALLQRAADGERLSAAEGERLLREASLIDLGLAADAVRRRKHPEGVVTYIVDRNVNYTNVCTTSCRFCAFYRPVGHAEGYVLSRAELAQKLQEVVDAGGVQILLQGGLNPDLPIGWYEDLFRWIKSEYRLGLHALSPEEILHIARLEGMTVRGVLERLVAAGLDSVPGGGAEILVDRVRRKIAKAKCTSEEWLSVMRTAHHMGLRSSATMMYGTVDSPRDRILHLLKLRDLQDETRGFTAFFCWDFQHESGVRVEAGDGGTHQYLRMQATSRLLLDNIDHVGASWVTQGPDVGQVALRFGADDFGSVMFEENVVSSAGTTYCIDAAEIERRIRTSGFRAARRNVKYDWLTPPA